MNQFEVKSVIRELNGMKDFADKALDVISQLVEENEILVDELKKRQFDQASYIPVKDIAKDMKCSIQTVINLIHSGQLKGKKAGRRWMVAYEDCCLELFILYKLFLFSFWQNSFCYFFDIIKSCYNKIY